MTELTSRQQDGRTSKIPWNGLPEGIIDALSGILRPWNKMVASFDVEMIAPPVLTMFQTELACESFSAPVHAPEPEVSIDPIRVLSNLGHAVHTLPLNLETTIATDSPCWSAPPVQAVPPLMMAFTVKSADFSILFQPACQSAAMAIERPKSRIASFGNFAGNFAEGLPRVSAISLKADAGQEKTLPLTLKPVAILRNDRFFGMPIRKTPVPPHRFSPMARDAFRQVLAEQAGTLTANIQLKAVFEHMRMPLYASIQADDRGGLLCVPRRRDQATAETESAWLALGVRLDNRESVRALVPRERLALLAGAPGTGENSG